MIRSLVAVALIILLLTDAGSKKANSDLMVVAALYFGSAMRV